MEITQMSLNEGTNEGYHLQEEGENMWARTMMEARTLWMYLILSFFDFGITDFFTQKPKLN